MLTLLFVTEGEKNVIHRSARMLRPIACAALILLAACGSQAAPATNPTSTTVEAPAATTLPPTSVEEPTGVQANTGLPACAGADTTIALPEGFPSGFPLPPGTVITSKEERSGGRLIINTVVPALDVKGVAEFFEQALPKAGFQITEGESEPGEAEANYEGNGYQGRWKVNTIAGCTGAVTLQVLAGKPE
jgi:hypothetical protein